MNWAMLPQVLEIWVEILGVVLLALYFLCGFVEEILSIPPADARRQMYE